MRKIEQYPDKALRPILISIVETLENKGVSLDDLLEDYEDRFIEAYEPIESELETYGLDSTTYAMRAGRLLTLPQLYPIQQSLLGGV
jgi:hypothetical protein